jgi:FkbM family methyltransferase
MIINKNYILQRIGLMMEERLQQQQAGTSALLKVYDKVPLRLRIFLRRQYRWFSAMFAAHKEIKRRNQKKFISYHYPMALIAVDFVRYCLEQKNFQFNTSLYFSADHESVIEKHIDERIKTVLCRLGCNNISRPMNSDEMAFVQHTQNLQSTIRKTHGFYKFTYENREYYLPRNTFEFGLWIFHYGLKQLPTTVKSYVVGKDFLDVGAFYGDSALVLLNYNPRRVFAYEPVEDQFRCLLKTVEKNGVQNKVFAIKKGLGDKETTLKIKGTGSAASLIDDAEGNGDVVIVTTIDAECNDKQIGIIKMDIEGFEYYAVKGGLETIKRDKPVLLISIYHTGRDFFEIPPMVKQCVPEYTFQIVDTCPTNITEKILVGVCNGVLQI